MKFDELSLDPRILAGIKNAGFDTPTPIQEQAIPHVLEGRDVLGLAQTGTGKTAAFILPILQHLTSGPLRRIRALVVAPTRELAEQIHQTAVELGKHTKIRSFPIYGGVSKGPQLGAVKRGTEIIVACPGRLLDHINEGHINLSGVEVLVLDEADRMCDMGFLPDIRRLIKQLPRERQNLFFSATMPKDIRNLADEMLRDPVTVQIGMIAPAKTVSHALYPVPQSRKKGLLFSMLDEFITDQVLIFTRTKRRARFLARDLEKQGYNVCALQGNMAQNRRQEAINGFRDGKYKILVATDIAARGIDVAEISHVINFDMPDTVDAYTHRIGRTGRAHATGEAFTFVDPSDESMVREIEKLLGKRIDRRTLEGFDYTAPKNTDSGNRRQNNRPQNGQQSRGNSGRGNSSRGNSGRGGGRDGNRQSAGRGQPQGAAGPRRGRHASASDSASRSTDERRERSDSRGSRNRRDSGNEGRSSAGRDGAGRDGGRRDGSGRDSDRRSSNRRSDGRGVSNDRRAANRRSGGRKEGGPRIADSSNLGHGDDVVIRSTQQSPIEHGSGDRQATYARSNQDDEQRQDRQSDEGNQASPIKGSARKPRPQNLPNKSNRNRVRIPRRNKSTKTT